MSTILSYHTLISRYRLKYENRRHEGVHEWNNADGFDRSCSCEFKFEIKSVTQRNSLRLCPNVIYYSTIILYLRRARIQLSTNNNMVWRVRYLTAKRGASQVHRGRFDSVVEQRACSRQIFYCGLHGKSPDKRRTNVYRTSSGYNKYLGPNI